ncbi:MAG TPA: ABC transporter permease [Candidatus Acidoferrum sp.]|jgi:putative ABC transport system permease protein|nr:ABC transporter permease [Candidatus Acidoferrum sp.]
MKLAWQNIVHDRARFSVTVLGVSFAVFLMVFQGSLLAGFLRAASRLIDASDSDIWITARGVQAFEFGTPIEGRIREMAAGVPGVLETSRVCMAFAVYRTPNGKQQVVALVGADSNVGKRFPVPNAPGFAYGMSPDAVLYDVSDRDLIQVTAMPAEVEVNRHRASIERQIDGYGAFLGVPFLFTSYRNATRYMGFGSEETMYILLRVDKAYSISDVQQNLRQRLPEVDVLTRDEFERKARTYWTIKTGAGGAILTAAVLGFLIGLVVVSQTVYANTMENIEEYATLKALGASQTFVARIVLTQALICGALGSVLGLLAVVPCIGYAKSLIPWIYTPWWLLLVMVLPSLAMCSLASIASVRSALTVEPGRVFRA